jgi:hypothetical protein
LVSARWYIGTDSGLGAGFGAGVDRAGVEAGALVVVFDPSDTGGAASPLSGSLLQPAPASTTIPIAAATIRRTVTPSDSSVVRSILPAERSSQTLMAGCCRQFPDWEGL